MRILFDIVHPAHVHFFRFLRTALEAEGHETLVVARDKDVTLPLLEAFGIPHLVHGRSGHSSMLGQARELLGRVWFLTRVARRFGADVVLTRNPAGVHAARPAGATVVFDTDDGAAAGIHFALAKPFAHLITSPDCLGEDHGERHLRYPSYKSLAYLHPNRFTPDADVRAELGLDPDEPLFLLRTVALDASHDTGAKGLSPTAQREIVDLLSRYGRVIITSEAPLPPAFEQHRMRVAPERMHDVLAAASLVVGDSLTVAAEAACLGVPCYRLSSFSGRVAQLAELEDRYQLVHNYAPGQEGALIEDLRAAITDLDTLSRRASEQRDRLLAEKVDLTDWYRKLLEDVMAKRIG